MKAAVASSAGFGPPARLFQHSLTKAAKGRGEFAYRWMQVPVSS
jgi:hypothetical protein